MFCTNDLTRYKIPKYFEFREGLPRTTVGKVYDESWLKSIDLNK